jgi:hypothetical protein
MNAPLLVPNVQSSRNRRPATHSEETDMLLSWTQIAILLAINYALFVLIGLRGLVGVITDRFVA